MKKIARYTSAIIALLLLMDILTICILDMGRLTNYGLGYLTGKIVLFLVMMSIFLLTRPRHFSLK